MTFELLLDLYITATILAIIGLILDLNRLILIFKEEELNIQVDPSVILKVIECFIPIYNVFLGYIYLYYGVSASDEEYKNTIE